MIKEFAAYLTGCLLIVLMHTAHAQSANTLHEPFLKINHIALLVHNLEASAAFSEKVMRLEKIPEPSKDGLHEWFSMNDVAQLHLIAGTPRNVFQDKKRHLCFSVASIDGFVTHLINNSIPYSDLGGKSNAVQLRADGVKQLYIQDPDGYWKEINDGK